MAYPKSSVLGSEASSKQDFSNQSNNSKKQSSIYLNIELNKFNNRAQYLNTPILVIYIKKIIGAAAGGATVGGTGGKGGTGGTSTSGSTSISTGIIAGNSSRGSSDSRSSSASGSSDSSSSDSIQDKFNKQFFNTGHDTSVGISEVSLSSRTDIGDPSALVSKQTDECEEKAEQINPLKAVASNSSKI
ncbi:hypothetical protein DICPUDRAFT_154902 [Dictyostelium purpureum]|uniref:Uncharacterized protein n=1 Tax=Dictyostelium purpureum TaxID=5786 RepID=F0ZSK0_DICPU|nr:uncharacterized protein DICPUDRAFT_154902 [Dictyostelium purpureum]EGC33079.1 hypothetical protein DICPUDRAFT_154902 [Dictyostelium purpureum]|eukprot:XP_003290392.1 hypothetical protein DICPUDRAFT_154902 [Dictyostelium purpureum]